MDKEEVRDKNSGKKRGDGKYEGVVCPNIVKKTEIQRVESRNCFPSWAGEDKYEVMHFMQNHIVYLKEMWCSCGMFQLVGYPCCHAIPAIDYHRLKMEDFIDECFRKEVYLKVYNHMIHPVPGMHDFEDSKMGRVEPPHVIIKMGRPKKCRRKDANDVKEIASRRGLTHTCTICMKKGHNKRSYTNPPPQFQIQSVPPVFQPSQDSQPQVPAYDPPPQTALRNPFKSSRTAPDETTTRGFNVHKPSYEQAVHSKRKLLNNLFNKQHPQSSGVHQQQPKALRKQKKPISLSSKLLKRQQQDAPDQSSQFKRKCCAERNPSISSLIKGLAKSYKPQQTKKKDGNASGTSNPT
ncbi:UNVERIFIED_CONTAM: hypothetical protein Sangu_2032400 [Sesamum angustifolium]|uniref:SWIM-type domain-containing protein n=1 Tax=Sesamum angustifolium TaxID=2727405 RepID=A0AAW2LJQ6_9LAMI